MAYGLRIWNPDASLAFDSTAAVGGVPIALHTVPSGSGTVAYSWASLAGRTIYVLPLVFGDYVPAAIDYSLGYPRVTYTKRAASSSTNLVLVA